MAGGRYSVRTLCLGTGGSIHDRTQGPYMAQAHHCGRDVSLGGFTSEHRSGFHLHDSDEVSRETSSIRGRSKNGSTSLRRYNVSLREVRLKTNVACAYLYLTGRWVFWYSSHLNKRKRRDKGGPVKKGIIG